ncbi:hypothetical protein [uncultured Sphingomonas sp.]|uniref:hypothetical protein n=1 Tax=uncultured Sphingomonas sp. TaxID=158754 RepID=UPI0025EB1EC8|nr:hypothetical protein [uncultured Sphingomonas sp.]
MTTKDWSPLHNPDDAAPRSPEQVGDQGETGAAAIARVRRFRAAFEQDDVIDQASGLTAADVDELIRLASGAAISPDI